MIVVIQQKRNILSEIKKLVEYANNNKNSELWFSYSGHGSYNFSNNEKDYKNEILCPCDYLTNGFITDDWLKSEFVDKLPEDCKLFVLMDCCHSGSNMDLPYYLNKDAKVDTRESAKDGEVAATIIKLSGCLDDQVSMDYYNSNMREFQGAFTNAFVKSFTKKMIVYNLYDLNNFLQSSNFKQISELAMSKPILWSWKVC